jgi:hypothetical protein
MFSTNPQLMNLLANEQQGDRESTFRYLPLLRLVGMKNKRGGIPMRIHRSLPRVVVGLFLTALIVLALWLPFRPTAAHTSSTSAWLPFRPSSQVVATWWLPFRSGNV